MTIRVMTIAAAAAAIAGCGSAPDSDTANVGGNSVAATKSRPAYCFFKDAETKGWSAATDAAGNVVVKGKAYRSDPRYKAQLGPAKIAGDTATLSPTIVLNDGYAAPDNWWDVSATIPDSSAVRSVIVQCGKKRFAELAVKR